MKRECEVAETNPKAESNDEKNEKRKRKSTFEG